MVNKKVALIIIVGIVAALIIGGSLIARRNQSSQATITPTPNFVEPTEEPTPTPEEEADIATFNVKVLNGTSTAGLAAKVQKQLEDVGFTVSSIGNADKKDYQQVIIQAKSTVPSTVTDTLKTTLGKTYTVGSVEELDSSEEDDIVVIVGIKVTATIAPTATQVKPTTATSVTGTPTVTQALSTPTPTP